MLRLLVPSFGLLAVLFVGLARPSSKQEHSSCEPSKHESSCREADAMGAAQLASTDDDVVRVFVFAGQSNMVGSDSRAADIDRFPPFAGLAEPQEDVRFRYVIGRERQHTSDGWVALAPVDGVVGPELSFARKVTERLDVPIAIVKVAAGGTHLGGDWNPDEPQGFELYPLLIGTVQDALADLAEDGVEHRLEGFVWHQGENDMFEDAFRANYGANLSNFMARVRTDLDAPRLPFFVGELCTKTVWGMDLREWMDAIARGQKAAVAEDPLAQYVPTSHVAVEIGGGEGLHYHYGTLGQLEHGIEHANAYLASVGASDPPFEPLERWPHDEDDVVQLWVLAGHRNMEGERAFVQELRDLKGGRRLAKPNDDVPLRFSVGGGVHASDGWVALAPLGPYDTFGPEVSFGATLARRSREPIALAKFTHSGSQLIDWTPNGSAAHARDLYADFIAFVEASLEAVEREGSAVELAGIVHHLGENDMSFHPYRREAARRIGALIEQSRADLGRPELRWFLSQQHPTEHESVDEVDVLADVAALAEGDPFTVHLPALESPPQEKLLVLDTAGVVWLGEWLAERVLDQP